MSFVDQIIQSAPIGSNPYAYAAEFITTVIPPKPAWFFSSLIAVGVVAAVNLVSTILSIVAVQRQSREGGAGFWFLKRQYGHVSGMPYIVPNALTMFLSWNLIFMMLLQVHIWLNYVAYHSLNIEILSRMYFWYGFVFIWDAIGMWTSAFGTLYVTLLPKLFVITSSTRSKFKAFLLHPATLNTLCFLPPAGFTITQIFTSVYSSDAWRNLVHTQFKLVDTLATLATQSAGGAENVQSSLLVQMTSLGNLFMSQKNVSQTAFIRNAVTCVIWYSLGLILFSPTAIWLLFTLRNAVKLRERLVNPRQTLPPDVPAKIPEVLRSPGSVSFATAQSTSSASGSGQPTKLGQLASANSVQYDNGLEKLKRAFYTVGLQCLATFFCMACTAGIWLWICFDTERMIVTPTLHAFAILFCIWVYAVTGCLVNLFVLIRAWRVRKSSSKGPENHVPMSKLRAGRTSTFMSSTHSDFDSAPKSVLVQTLTTTHTVVETADSMPRGSERKHALELSEMYCDDLEDGKGPEDSSVNLDEDHKLKVVVLDSR